jgi:hypothetical protein
MKKYDITKIVQEEVLAKLDEYITSTSSIPIQKPSKIAPLPGAPFGGNLSLVMNNPAKAALRQWAIFCKACQQKFGDPGDWPQSMVDVAQKLGSKIEKAVSTDTTVREADEPITAEKKPAEQAKELGLVYGGYGNWIDPKTKETVAKTINGKLVKTTSDASKAGEKPAQKTAEPESSTDSRYTNPEQIPPIHPDPVAKKPLDKDTLKKLIKMVADRTDLDVDPETDKQMKTLFKEAGRDPYQPQGLDHISPRWNKGMDTNDVPYDANGEQTVDKLLAMVGDPLRLLKWLVSKLKKETANGRQRILQYIGILFDKGLIDAGEVQDAEAGNDPTMNQ